MEQVGALCFDGFLAALYRPGLEIGPGPSLRQVLEQLAENLRCSQGLICTDLGNPTLFQEKL